MSNARIGALRIDLGLNTAAFERGITLADRRMKRLERSMDQFGQKMQTLGRNMTLALTVPLAAIGVQMSRTAIDAEELQAAFDQTFGNLAGEMNRWARETGDAMGRSTQAMQRGAFALGGLFNAAAPTREEAAGLAREFTVLSQDLASFFNVAEDDALDKLRSGLSGEAEPLRRFSVYLNEATVQQEALRMGLVRSGEALTDQQKILARANIILQQTRDAQGDVIRTNDSSANTLRRAQAAWEEMSVTLGAKLLPIITRLAEHAVVLLDRFSALPDGIQDTVLMAAALTAAIGPLLLVFGTLTRGLALLMTPLGRAGVTMQTMARSQVPALAAAFTALRAAMTFLTGPWGVLLMAVSGGLAAIALEGRRAADVIEESRAAGERLEPVLRAIEDAASGASEEVEGLGSAVESSASVMQAMLGWVDRLSERFRHLAGSARMARMEMLVTELQQGREREQQLQSRTEPGFGGMFTRMFGLAEENAAALEQERSRNARIDRAIRLLRNDIWANPSPDAADAEEAEAPGSTSSGGGRTRTGPTAAEIAARRTAIELQHELDVAIAAGNVQRQREIELIQQTQRRIDELKEAGYSEQDARTLATAQMLEVLQAETRERERQVLAAERAFDIDLARMRNDVEHLRDLEREEWLTERIAYWEGQGLKAAEAKSRALEDQAQWQAAIADAAREQFEASRRDHERELMRLRRDDPDAFRAVEEIDRFDARVRELTEEMGRSRAEAEEIAMREATERNRAHLQGTFRDTFRDGLYAALNGRLGDWFEQWMRDRTFNALSRVLDRLADRLADLVAQGGGGGGGILGALGGLFGAGGGGGGGSLLGRAGAGLSSVGGQIGRLSLPGFAEGGAFRLRGLSGQDTNLLSVNGSPIARVSSGELMHIQSKAANDVAGTTRVLVELDPGLRASIVQESAANSVQIVRAARPGIVNEAAAMTRSSLTRRRL